jgi:hypothetical protein
LVIESGLGSGADPSYTKRPESEPHPPAAGLAAELVPLLDAVPASPLEVASSPPRSTDGGDKSLDVPDGADGALESLEQPETIKAMPATAATSRMDLVMLDFLSARDSVIRQATPPPGARMSVYPRSPSCGARGRFQTKSWRLLE